MNNRKITIIFKWLCVLLFIFMFVKLPLSQVTQQWVQTYNGTGNGNDDPYCVTYDASGNVFVAGTSYGGSNTYNDYVIVKYNASGVQQWVRSYNGSGAGDDYPTAIAVDNSGNIFVTGVSMGNGTDYDYATIKINTSGTVLYSVRYNGTGNGIDRSKAMAIDGSGNVYITGVSRGSGTNNDIVTIKYNSSLVQQWAIRYNGTPDNSGNAIAVDGSGNVYVTGYSFSPNHHFVTIKYNASGGLLWLQNYTGPANGQDESKSIALDASGNVYITGSSPGTSSGYDYAVIKYNTSGVQQWVQRYNGPGNGSDIPTAIGLDGSANVYVTGYCTVSGTNTDYATIKYSTAGVQQWVVRYNGQGNAGDQPNDMFVDANGNVYVTGYSAGTSSGNDFATIKYNSSGTQQWLQRYDDISHGADYSNSIAVDASGNVYIAGEGYGIGTSFDYTVIKYSQPTGIKIASDENPSKFNLFQNYPNPFNPSTNINYKLPFDSWVSITVYDMNGKTAATLVNDYKKSGYYSTKFDGTSLASGVYFYKVEAGDFVNVKKMVLLK